nr:hypothetical protein [Tanacetum cinerariifolium]
MVKAYIFVLIREGKDIAVEGNRQNSTWESFRIHNASARPRAIPRNYASALERAITFCLLLLQARGDCFSPYKDFFKRNTSLGFKISTNPEGVHIYFLFKFSIQEDIFHVKLMERPSFICSYREDNSDCVNLGYRRKRLGIIDPGALELYSLVLLQHDWLITVYEIRREHRDNLIISCLVTLESSLLLLLEESFHLRYEYKISEVLTLHICRKSHSEVKDDGGGAVVMMMVWVGDDSGGAMGLALEIKANVTSSKPDTIQSVVSMANRLTTDGINNGIFKKENVGDKKRTPSAEKYGAHYRSDGATDSSSTPCSGVARGNYICKGFGANNCRKVLAWAGSRLECNAATTNLLAEAYQRAKPTAATGGKNTPGNHKPLHPFRHSYDGRRSRLHCMK